MIIEHFDILLLPIETIKNRFGFNYKWAMAKELISVLGGKKGRKI